MALWVLVAREGRHHEDLKSFRDAAHRELRLPEAHEGMGEAYSALRMPALAQEVYLGAIEVFTGNVRAAADPSFLPAWLGFLRALDAAERGQVVEGRILDLEGTDPALV